MKDFIFLSIHSFSSAQCLRCQTNSITTQNTILRVNSNKRSISSLDTYDADETDSIVPIYENKPELRQSKSEPVN